MLDTIAENPASEGLDFAGPRTVTRTSGRDPASRIRNGARGKQPESASPATSEDALVAQAIDGDETAFTRLYDLYYDRVYRHVYYRIGPHDAEDITQQVFLQAWRALGRFQQTSAPFIAWLFTISHNTVVSFYRRNKWASSLDSDAITAPGDDGVEGSVENKLEHERARRAIAQLNPDQQQVLTLRFLEDLAPQEVSATLGKSQGNVRVIQHRALRELRRLMEEEAETEGRRPAAAARIPALRKSRALRAGAAA
jgi:RNA polymerase sigma-70 factor (ECF subfamily)